MDQLIRDSLIVKFNQGALSKAEQQQLLEWVNLSPENKQFFEDIQRAWKIIQDPAAQTDFATDQEWVKLISQIQLAKPYKGSDKGNSTKVYRLNSWIWRSAAAVVLLITAYFIMSRVISSTNERSRLVTKSTTKQEKQRYSLPDGSTVWLNERSTISYPEKFGEHNREVSLIGEAFFEVAEDAHKPFIIHGSQTITQVLGTSFNLRARPGEETVEVTVVSGKVSFSKEEASEQGVILTAGMKGAYYTRQDSLYQLVNTDPNFRAWQTNQLVFKDVPLREVVIVLTKHYNTYIKPTNRAILNCRFTSTFEQASLEEILEAITLSLDLRYHYDGRQYILTGEGCL